MFFYFLDFIIYIYKKQKNKKKFFSSKAPVAATSYIHRHNKIQFQFLFKLSIYIILNICKI